MQWLFARDGPQTVTGVTGYGLRGNILIESKFHVELATCNNWKQGREPCGH